MWKTRLGVLGPYYCHHSSESKLEDPALSEGRGIQKQDKIDMA